MDNTLLRTIIWIVTLQVKQLNNFNRHIFTISLNESLGLMGKDSHCYCLHISVITAHYHDLIYFWHMVSRA